MPILPPAILFDLDDTIISAGSRKLLFATLAEEFAAVFAPLAPAEAARRLQDHAVVFWDDPARHAHWRMNLAEGRRAMIVEAFASMVAEAAGATPEAAEAFAARLHAAREENRCFPGAIETLETIKAAGVKMALVTNGDSAGQRAKVERFDLARLFDHIQIEGEAGFGKPEERAYLHAMQALRVTPAETWMVGDNLEWEVAAPQRLGIHAVWHDHLGEGLPQGSPYRPDRIIRTLSELLD
jgi:putative hydrolase of the HAD superfamily